MLCFTAEPLLYLIKMQNCQIDGGNGYIIGDKGTEEMWINEDGDPFLYYTGSDARYLSIPCNL